MKPINFNSDIDFICFTDDKNFENKGWKPYHYKNEDLSIIENTRRIKFFPHYFLKKYDETMYVDSNISIQKDPNHLFDKYLFDKNCLAIPNHPYRKCVYKEARFLIKIRFFSSKEKSILESQIKYYMEKKMPSNYGLTENNIILRTNNSFQNKLMSQLWWNEFINGCKRDQISLPYIIWKKKINFKNITESPRFSNYYFNIHLHKKQRSENKLIEIKRLINIRSRQNLFINLLNKVIKVFQFFYEIF